MFDPPFGCLPIGDDLVTSIFGYFDESGKWLDHDVVSFAGLMSPMDDWLIFHGEWSHLLRKHEIASLHMTSGLNFALRGTARKKLGFDERCAILGEFVGVIKKNLSFGQACAVDIRAFKSLPSHQRRKVYKGDPYLLAFATVINRVVDRLSKGEILSIVCDDEEHYAVRCYKMLAQAKNNHPYLRKAITSICFGDDKQMVALQAADMLAYLMRAEAAFRMHATEYKYADLYKQLASGQSRMGYEVRLWDEESLSKTV